MFILSSAFENLLDNRVNPRLLLFVTKPRSSYRGIEAYPSLDYDQLTQLPDWVMSTRYEYLVRGQSTPFAKLSQA